MTRVRIVLAGVLLVTGCLREPDPGAVQTSSVERCLSCHLHDYQDIAPPAPTHAGVFPRSCDDCHRTEGWQPAIEGLHPAAPFRIEGGPHGDVACLDCHDPDRGPSADGMNTTCTGCHTHRRSEVDGEHDDEPGYRWDDGDPSFCLRCHPSGREED